MRGEMLRERGIGPGLARGRGRQQRRLPAAELRRAGVAGAGHRAGDERRRGRARARRADDRRVLRRRARAPRARRDRRPRRPDRGQQRARARARHQRFRRRLRRAARARTASRRSSSRTCCARSRGMQFDTIYHEHFSYLSLLALAPLFARHGLEIVEVDRAADARRLAARVRRAAAARAPVDAERRAVVRRRARAGLRSHRRPTRRSARASRASRTTSSTFLIDARARGKTRRRLRRRGQGDDAAELRRRARRPDAVRRRQEPAQAGPLIPGVRVPIVAPERIRARPAGLRRDLSVERRGGDSRRARRRARVGRTLRRWRSRRYASTREARRERAAARGRAVRDDARRERPRDRQQRAVVPEAGARRRARTASRSGSASPSRRAASGSRARSPAARRARRRRLRAARRLAQRPYVGEPGRTSTSTSYTAPRVQRISLASACGARWKCSPRIVPARGCAPRRAAASSSSSPCAANASASNVRTNQPRSSCARAERDASRLRRARSAMTSIAEGGFWHGRRVLVTGHTGFKGAWLCALLLRRGATVCGLALPPATTPEPVGARAVRVIRRGADRGRAQRGRGRSGGRARCGRRRSSIWPRSRWCGAATPSRSRPTRRT